MGRLSRLNKARISALLFAMTMFGCELFNPYTDTDGVIRSRMTELNCAGLAAGIVTEDGLAWRNEYGVADKANHTPVTEDTLFAIASVSKTITGILAMKALDEDFAL